MANWIEDVFANAGMPTERDQLRKAMLSLFDSVSRMGYTDMEVLALAMGNTKVNHPELDLITALWFTEWQKEK